ncbi:MAG TPA: type II 3-dehydroquinate dehydratase [Gemmatimonadales bacterium]|nr:type II 3-dehydroquinate dehydratase [Gemmatimonadales bacterium]
MTRIAVLNGPNLDLLGLREPEIYGRTTFAELEAMVRDEAATLGVTLDWFQTNHEGAFLDKLRTLRGTVDGCVINAAAWTHDNLAVRDAVLAFPVPFVEVHLSNIFAREPERRHSMLADKAVGFICGFGARGYVFGLRALVEHLDGS